jgi:hypothetical protein
METLAFVTRVLPTHGYAFLKSTDDEVIFLHRSNFTDFATLAEGDALVIEDSVRTAKGVRALRVHRK